MCVRGKKREGIVVHISEGLIFLAKGGPSSGRDTGQAIPHHCQCSSNLTASAPVVPALALEYVEKCPAGARQRLPNSLSSCDPNQN